MKLGSGVLAGVSLSLAIALAPWQGADAQDAPEKPAPDVAAMFKRRCAGCHTVPDVGLRTDRAWLDQVKRTAWTATPERARAALIDWLKSDASKTPARVDALPPKDDTASALVVSDLAAGSILLRGEKGDVALVWKQGEKGGKRPLPPGPYYLISTRVERMQGKQHWFLSTTGPQQGAAMKLQAGKTKRMDVTDTVHFAGTMKRAKKGGAFQLGFSIKAAGGRGLSVYRDDRRVPVTFEVLSKGGKVLGSGNMNYG